MTDWDDWPDDELPGGDAADLGGFETPGLDPGFDPALDPALDPDALPYGLDPAADLGGLPGAGDDSFDDALDGDFDEEFVDGLDGDLDPAAAGAPDPAPLGYGDELDELRASADAAGLDTGGDGGADVAGGDDGGGDGGDVGGGAEPAVTGDAEFERVAADPPIGADPDVGTGADPGGHAFPEPLALGEPPEPVDGFPWTDADLIGGDGVEPLADPTGAHGAPRPDDLYAYAAEEPTGEATWSELAASPDPATSTLARFWSEGGA